MALASYKKAKGLNLALLVFSLLILGGAAVFLSQNKIVDFMPSAKKGNQVLTGQLFKANLQGIKNCFITGKYILRTGSSVTGVQADAAFQKSPSVFNAYRGRRSNVNYLLLIGPGMEWSGTDLSADMAGIGILPPRGGQRCVGIVANDSLASPFVGKNVIVGGTMSDGIFYVTSIKPVPIGPLPPVTSIPRATDGPKPTCVPRPACLDSKTAPCMIFMENVCPPAPTPSYILR